MSVTLESIQNSVPLFIERALDLFQDITAIQPRTVLSSTLLITVRHRASQTLYTKKQGIEFYW